MAEHAHEDRLIKADRNKIMREAQVRAALEQPDFAEKEFGKWRTQLEREFAREHRLETFAQAWAKVAWLAEGRMNAMGRELDKLQHRIGRQRKANRKQYLALKEAEARVERLGGALRFYADERNWKCGAVIFEKGERARTALSDTREEE